MPRFRHLLVVVLLIPLVPVAAQHSTGVSPHTKAEEPFGRLHVRPHAMTLGTTNAKAGVEWLSGFPRFGVYVPPYCVGTKRCPLVVYVHGGGWNAKMQLDAQRDLADKYGMILLLPTAYPHQSVFDHPTVEPSPLGYTTRVLAAPSDTDGRLMDSAMTAVLHTHAIDPDKIAVMGFSNGGSYSLFLGRNNQDIFSRVGGLSAIWPLYGEWPKNSKAMFLLSTGLFEQGQVVQMLGVAKELRADGRAVETVAGLRGHVALREDDDYAWHWLARSWHWHTPASMQDMLPKVLADSDPVLTVEGMQKLTAFWTRFAQEPDSIQSTARPGHYSTPRPGQQGAITSPFMEAVTLQIGQLPVTVVKTNMAALAAAYPSVAADLKAAGLTAAEEEGLRMATVRVELTRQAQQPEDLPAGHVQIEVQIAASSVLARNLAFRDTHPEAFDAHMRATVWSTP